MNFQFGVDYYPEHWPEERWEMDVELMHKMGLNVVRIAEFSWHKMEPEEGKFQFDWLNRILEILDKYKIKAVLGTPTAAPPAWLIEKYPDILPIDSSGIQRGFGGRHHNCQSNPVYRRYSASIVTAMAECFGTDSRVVGWQPDNEFGNSHQDFCHCSHCRQAFQDWLQQKYQQIDKLNEAWGTCFWSQEYDSFNQIPTPLINPNSHNPSLLLDWKRFHSDLIVDFQQKQIDILRKKTKGQFITHNFMSFSDVVDYFDLAEPLNFVSHDQYITGYWEILPGITPAEQGAALDQAAGFKQASFWIMEQQAGSTGWEIMGRAPKPGQLALWAFQSIAHGADTVIFFRWRTCTVGTEQYWHGILPHNGVPGRRYQELRELISTLSSVMPEFEGTLNGAEVAILHSYDQNWAIEIQPHHPDLNYMNISKEFYSAFFEKNIPVAYIPESADFDNFKLIVAPLMFLDLPGIAQKLNDFVQSGGQVVFTPRTGVKDYENRCQSDSPLPGPYTEMLGIEVLEYDCLRGAEVEIQTDSGIGKGRFWWDEVTPCGADTFFDAQGLEHPGEPALSGNQYGKGYAWYSATFPDNILMSAMADLWIKKAGINSLGSAPEGIELVRRSAKNHDYLFVINHIREEITYNPGKEWVSVLGEENLIGYGFALYKKEKLLG